MSMIDTYIPTSTSSTTPMFNQPISGRKGTRFFWGVTIFSSLLGGLFAARHPSRQRRATTGRGGGNRMSRGRGTVLPGEGRR